MDLKTLIEAMTTKETIVMKEAIQTPLELEQCYQARDAFTKHLYQSLFSWIVQKVNSAISVGGNSESAYHKKKNSNFIGLLDIFGFEIFTKNSFE